MTPEQMRELADILEPMAAAPRFDGLPVAEFCAWLRQCAEQRPVAWIAHNLPTGHVKWTTDRCHARSWTRSVNLRVTPLYAAPVPPQRDLSTAERGVLDESLRKSVKVVARGKREPLSDERIDEIGEPFGYFQYGDAQGDKRRAFVRAIERAHGIGGSDER